MILYTFRAAFTATLTLSLLALFVFTAAAQTATPKPTATPVEDPSDEVIRVDSKLIVVPVSVTDGDGQPVLGLKDNDFKISEEGKPQVIDHVGAADQVPLEIALLFDVSASTDKMFRFEQETAAKFLKGVMRDGDRATIFSIGMTPTLVQPRDTSDKSVQSILSITPQKGATAYFDTVRAAADYLKINAPPGSRKVIVVISDGDDNYSIGVQKAQLAVERGVVDSKPDPELKRLASNVQKAQEKAKVSERVKVLKALQNADTVHYSINPGGSSYQLNQMSVFGQENMQTFADDTGGTAFLPKFLPVDGKDEFANNANMRKNGELLDRIFRQLTNELRSQYLIQYYSEAEFQANKFVKLDVGMTGRTGVKVRARRGYYVKN